ncbi:YIP1 family protein [Thioclava sp. GXIMD4216]|uniref:YIP1 family protein n=1 Tax=Thioclava litoralis TaxID=3076557 RepID=A0ABZ1DYY5_9RHOB|nr:YIP1 family protein [Thioclava sp. FTW29]
MEQFTFRQAILGTITQPQSVARALIDWNPPTQARWLGLAVVVVLSACLGLFGQVLASTMVPDTERLSLNPIPMILIQAAILIYAAGAMTFVGRMGNGHGAFRDALLLMTWAEFVMVILQVVQLALIMILPSGLGATTVILLTLMFYFIVNFVAALHGFRNLAVVAIGTIVTFFASAFATGLVLMLLGVMPSPSP